MSLDDVLAAWAAGVRLDDATATGIYQRIVQTPRPDDAPAPGLDAAWWRTFTADCATWVVNSNRPLRWAA
jgi:hypothetical protein